MSKTADEFVVALGTNVDDWYADRIDYAAFDVRQRATWGAIAAAGPEVLREVSSILNARLKTALMPRFA